MSAIGTTAAPDAFLTVLTSTGAYGCPVAGLIATLPLLSSGVRYNCTRSLSGTGYGFELVAGAPTLKTGAFDGVFELLKLVMPSLVNAPLSVAAVRSGGGGAGGIVVSMVIVFGVTATLVEVRTR